MCSLNANSNYNPRSGKILVTTGVRFRKAFGNRCVLKTEIVDLNQSKSKSQLIDDFTCRGGSVGGLLQGRYIL